MAGLLAAVRRKSKDKLKRNEKRKNKTTGSQDKIATSRDKKKMLRGMSRGDAGDRFTGLLTEAGYQDDEASKPIRFNNSGGSKRYHYGSQPNGAFCGLGSLGVQVSKYKSCAPHEIDLDDTWAKLSLAYSVSIDDLQRFNKMYTNDSLMSRRQLLIPLNAANKDLFDPSIIMPAAQADKRESPEGDGAESADSPAESPTKPGAVADSEPATSKPTASDFLAAFDTKFGKTKANVTKKSSEIVQLTAAKIYGDGDGSGKSLRPLDRRIGNGIKGDTSHVSYQRR